MKPLINRWTRVANRLPAEDLKYGIAVVGFLEKQDARALAYFDDPVEAAMVFACLGVIWARKNARGDMDQEKSKGLDKWLQN